MFNHWWKGVSREERRNKGREQTPRGREGLEGFAFDRKRDSSSLGTERKIRM